MKRKTFTKVMAIVLAILLLGSLVLSVLGYLMTGASASSELDELTQEQEQVQQRREELEQQQRELNSQRAAVQGTIRELSSSIEDLERQRAEYDELVLLTDYEMVNLSQQVSVLEDEIDVKRAEYEIAAANEAEQRLIFRKKLRALEENGDISYYEILFEDVADFGDLLSRLDMIDELNARDEAIIAEMEAAKQEVILAQQALYNAKDECERKQAEQAELKLELEKLIEEATGLIRELEGELELTEEEEQEWASRVAHIEEEIRITEAEDREIADRIEELERQDLLKNAGVTATGTYLWPSADSYYVTSLYGMRYHPVLFYYTKHNGIDIGAPLGTNVYASDGGVVVTSQKSESYGNYVMIAHGNGRYTLYAHLDVRYVSVDDVVSQGDVIGLCGSTGYSTGPHIHFEVYENDERVDPLQFFDNYVVLG